MIEYSVVFNGNDLSQVTGVWLYNYMQSTERYMSVINCENFMGINDVLIYSRISQVSHAAIVTGKQIGRAHV